jgi:chaperonin GroES
MSLDKLKEYIKLDNIAEELEEDKLQKISVQVSSGFDDDFQSSAEWRGDVKRVLELASLKAVPKNTPLPNSANIKYPIITKAVYEFSSRVYPEVVKDDKVIKTRIIGKDIDGSKRKQSDRVETYLNYQLLFKSTEWEQSLDKLLTMLPLIGFICKKTYYEPIRGEIKSDNCDYNDLIIHADVDCLANAPRISHVLHLSLNDLIEHVRSGLFLEEPIQELIDQNSNKPVKGLIDIVEQHCYLDLDEDDYEEPYIVTFLKDSKKIVRIAARFTSKDIKTKDGKVKYIDGAQYFTDYHFLVSPKGKFQSVGFGMLLLHLNETINTLLNEITDAGQLSNLQGGYIDSRAKLIESGDTMHDPGELKKIKTSGGLMLKDSVHMIDFKEPSAVLYQTLGLLIDSARDLSSSTDVMTGNSGTDNVKTGAVLALQEEGRKVLTSIQKRIYRSLSAEYKKIFKLNSLYLDPKVYLEILDDDLAVSQDDFDETRVNVIPVADPNLSSASTRVQSAQFLAGVIQFPGVKPEKITRRIIESTTIENPEELLMSDEEMQQAKQQPNPDVIKTQADIEEKAQLINAKHRELDLEEKRVQIELYKTQCECLKLKADAILSLAQAEGEKGALQFQQYQMQLDVLSKHIDTMMQAGQMNQDQQQHQDEMSMRQQELDQGQQEVDQNAQQGSGMDTAPSQPSS